MHTDDNYLKSDEEYPSLNYSSSTYSYSSQSFASRTQFLQNTPATTSFAVYSLIPPNFTSPYNMVQPQTAFNTSSTATTTTAEIQNVEYIQSIYNNWDLHQMYNTEQCNLSRSESFSSTQSYVLNYGYNNFLLITIF